MEADGRLALQLTESGELSPDWTAKLCLGPDGRSLVYLSSDGFMVPLITNDEKVSRREKVVRKRHGRDEGRAGDNKQRRRCRRVKRGRISGTRSSRR